MKYYLGRSLQIVGLITLTIVVILFFDPKNSMGKLLTWSMVAAIEFYGGTLLLEKE